MRLVVLLSILLGGGIVRAGGVGNGGIAVVCRAPNGQIRSAELLDYYEASVRGIPIKLGGPTLSVQDKLNMMLNRLDARGDFRRADLYRKWVAEFFSPKYTRFLRNTTLEKTNDVYNNSFPDGCGPEQLIIQQKPEFPEDRLWTVSQDIWDKMDNDNRAGAVMHEVMYREALNPSYGLIPKDSRRIRYFNSYVAGDMLASMTEEQYIKFIAYKVELGTVSAQGAEFELCMSSDPTCGGPVFEFYKSSNGQVIRKGYPDFTPIEFGGNTYVPSSYVTYYPDGNFRSIVNLQQNTSGTVKINGQTLRIGWNSAGADARFFPNGAIRQVPIKDQFFNLHGLQLSIGSYVILDEAQNLRETALEQPATISVNGREIQAVPGKIVFDRNGNLLGANSTTPQNFDSPYFHLKAGPGDYYFELHPNGGLKTLRYYDGRVFVGGVWRTVEVPVDGVSNLSFYENGAPNLVTLAEDIRFQIQGKTLTALHKYNVEFDPHAHVLNAEVARGGWLDQHRDWVDLTVNGQSIRFSRACGASGNGCKMLFYPDGHVKAGMLYKQVEYRNPDGTELSINKGVVFDDKGQILKADVYYY